MHVRMADESVCIGPPPAALSYLSMPNIIAACEITGAEAIHPGYGFLSENAKFVQICEDHGLKFIGPTSEHIRLMGDKITAKETMKNLGVPCVPGSDGGVPTLDEARKVAAEIGYPVIVKATAGGGGRGMKLAEVGRRDRHRLPDRAGGGQGRLRQRRGLSREVPRHAAPHRGAGLRRRQGQGGAPRRARLLAAAAAPEGDGGGALAGHRRQDPGADRPDLRRRGGEDRLCRRRDDRVPLRERRVLLHRDEHPPAGRAPGDRGDLRRRPGAGADPRRRRPADVLHPGRARARRPRHRVPDQRREAAAIPAEPGQDQHLLRPGRPRRAHGQRHLRRLHHPALLRQPDRQADRARPHPRAGAGAAAAGALGAGGRRGRHHDAALRRAARRARHPGGRLQHPLAREVARPRRREPPMRDDVPEITPALLLQAYASGVFPMAESGGRATSSSGSIPRRRGILPLDGLHVSRRLARSFLARRFRDPGRRATSPAWSPPAPSGRRPGSTTAIRRLYRDLHRHGPRAFGGDLARRARWPAGSTASRSAAPSSARACSAAAATPRSSR